MREWLPSGTTIGRYQVSSRLSANGLGEVYLAKDTLSGRDIALKLLPASLVTEQNLRQRFIKIFASLAKIRHRHICEIYEGGVTENGRPFIAMEYVKGQSFDLLGSGHQLTVDEIITIVIQIAEALEAAHSKGWLHLAIKPSNLVLTPSRDVKILDLGQALAFPLSLSSETTESLKVPLGAAHYLSPEQVADDKPDQRSDVFSLGAVFYELITGHSSFAGSTIDEVIAAITIAEPPPLSNFREDLPPELNRIAAKALAKDLDKRYQTPGELARDLRNLDSRQPKWAKWTAKAENEKSPEAGADGRTAKTAAELRGRDKGDGARGDKLSPVSFFDDLKQGLKNLLEGSKQKKTGHAEPIQIIRDRPFLEDLLYVIKNYRNRIIIISLAILGVILAVFVAGRYLSRTMNRGTLQSLQITRITASGQVTEAVISPFGERLAYAVDEGGQQSLIIKELESGMEMRIATDPTKEYRGLAFSPNGQWVSYIKSEPNNPFGSLFRKSVSGGQEEGLNKGDIVSASCFSPDSKKIAYVSAGNNRSESTLNIGPPENSGVVLAKRQSPSFFHPDGLAWSPDGRVIACVVRDRESGLFLKIIAVDVEGGGESTIVSGRWSEIDQIAWLGNGSGLVIAAKEPTSRSSQLWRVSYPSSEVTRITRDMSDYQNASLTYDSDRLVSIQSEALSNIWMASSVDFSQTRQLTTERFDGFNGLAWTPDDRIAFVSWNGGRETIWASDLTTGKRQPLPVAPEGGQGGEFQPAVSPDGHHIVYIVERPSGSYLWRSELNRRNLKRLTDENLIFYPTFTADGKSVIYSVLREERRVVAKSTIEGGAPMTLVEKQAWRPVVSPDGTKIACNYWDDMNAQWKIAVFPSEGGQPLMIFDAPGDFERVVRWMPDGNGMSFIVTRGGSSNIWMQPLEGGMPKQLTGFKTGRIFDFAWSRDGQRIAFAQGSLTSDVVLIQNFK
jgi:serine/threonine protein kinase/Tol biopolymer transport system component